MYTEKREMKKSDPWPHINSFAAVLNKIRLNIFPKKL